MVIRAQVADLVTGERIQDLPASRVTWERRILSPESLTVSLTLKPRAHQLLDLRNATVEAKSALIVSDGDTVLGAGPVWSRSFDDDNGRFECSAEGVWSLLDFVHVLPDTVSSLPLVVLSGTDEGEPNPAVATSFVGQSWPQIVKGLLDQVATRAGGVLPFVYGDMGTGSHDKSYDAAAFKTVGDALTDLTRLADGPEIEFRPQLVDNKLRWLVRVGDDVQPELRSPTVHVFDFSAVKKTVRKLSVKSSGTGLASEAWGTGGRQASIPLFARAFDPALITAGFPRMEALSSAHSTVVEQETLDQYTTQDLRRASAPLEWWSWEFKSDVFPRISDVSVGDYCMVRIKDHKYLPDGEFVRRIVGMSGDNSSSWVKVTTDEVMTW